MTTVITVVLYIFYGKDDSDHGPPAFRKQYCKIVKPPAYDYALSSILQVYSGLEEQGAGPYASEVNKEGERYNDHKWNELL